MLLLVLAHLGWWYWPRPRQARLDPETVTGRLFTEGRLPVALWLAYPHQNLGALEASFGATAEERARFLAATARLADLPEPALPGFGPFATPPARDLVALSDEAGERVLVAARIYPGLALVARLAGKLAGNPWLAGGEVDAFGGAARVEWDGSLWSVGNVPAASLLPEVGERGAVGERLPEGPAGGESLAALRLATPVGFVPAGLHRLEALEDGLRLASGGLAASGQSGGLPSGGSVPETLVELLEAVPVGEDGVALLAVSGPGGPLEDRRSAGAPTDPDDADPVSSEAASSEAAASLPASPDRGALALFPGRGGGGLLGGLLADLPGAAVWYRPGAERFRLPAEDLLGGSRQEAPGTAGSWAVVATSADSLGAASALTSTVDRLATTATIALAADPGRALAAVDAALRVLRVVPLTSRSEVRRWEDWRTVLAPLAGFRSLGLVVVADDGGAPPVAGEGGGLWLRLRE